MDAFPLHWPEHIPRTPDQNRRFGGFQVTPGEAMKSLRDEVARSKGTGLIISSNVPVRSDGLPYANAKEPSDPGVAVYFTRKGEKICMACDAFDRVWKNVRALALSIADMRGPEVRGCASLTDQAFRGFAALPPPNAAKPWTEVLGLPRSASIVEISEARKRIARKLGADNPRMAEVNAAHDQALEEKVNG